MSVSFDVKVPADGCLELRWDNTEPVMAYTLLLMRTGSVPAHTVLELDSKTRAYRVANLGRHQRYRVAVIARCGDGNHVSAWWEVTPRVGVAPRLDPKARLDCMLAQPRDVTVMPQHQRLTLWWKFEAGFIDGWVLHVCGGGQEWRLELEPEVTSLSLDSGRGVALQNGQPYSVTVASRFAGSILPPTEAVSAVPASQGNERKDNLALPQRGLVYPALSVEPEVQVFEDDEPEVSDAPAPVLCGQCRTPLRWTEYRLNCETCASEFIPNGYGAFLDVAKLRFGTCACCLPKKILVRSTGEASLRCAHSQKEHIRLPRERQYRLIEDLPYGLCQCCRPRRALAKLDGRVSCTRSKELHQNQAGRWVLLPSQPVFDAAAVDRLLDAGLADICSTGVSRASA